MVFCTAFSYFQSVGCIWFNAELQVNKEIRLNMKLLKYLFLLMVVTLAGCLINSEENQSDPIPVSANQIRNASVSGRTISIVAACETPTPCWCFSYTKHIRSANTYTVTVFARLTTNDPCITIVGSTDAPFNVTVEVPGSYSFRFWRSDDATVDTTLVVS